MSNYLRMITLSFTFLVYLLHTSNVSKSERSDKTATDHSGRQIEDSDIGLSDGSFF